MKNIYVFPHIPKTAGQTIRHNLTEFLGPESVLHIKTEKELNELSNLSLSNKLKLSIIQGHGIKKNIIEKSFSKDIFKIFYIIALRDPVERWISVYNYRTKIKNISEKLSLLNFFNQFDEIQKNYQIYWIYKHFLDYKIDHRLLGIEEIYKIVKNELKSFFLIGTLDNFKYFSKKISNILKIPEFVKRLNTKGIDYKLYDNGSEDDRKKIFLQTTFDRKLLEELNLL